MEIVEPRYEFRIWGDALDPLRRRLEQFCSAPQPEQSCETYIVSDATDANNAKIRAGAIDIKLLLHVEQRLEQWRPYLKAAFPLDALTIGREIFASLRVDTPPLQNRSYSAEAFINELVRPHPRLAAAEVRKRRWRFLLDDCASEFVEVIIGGGTLNEGAAALHSVAIESISLQSALAAIARLEIGAYPNISYVRQIKSLLGRPRGK
jgi:hypothetical protein